MSGFFKCRTYLYLQVAEKLKNFIGRAGVFLETSGYQKHIEYFRFLQTDPSQTKIYSLYKMVPYYMLEVLTQK